MTSTKVFQNGNSQAIRIPHDMRTDHKDYYISKVGDIYILFPSDDPWASTRQAIGTFEKEFMADRRQPSWSDADKREEL